MKDKDCRVDCWILPRTNEERESPPLRYSLYRLLVQGLRRCQGLAEVKEVSINGYSPEYRQFYSGRPVFCDEKGNLVYDHPQNSQQWTFDREVNIDRGSFYWRLNEEPLIENGESVWDSKPMWGFDEQGGGDVDVGMAAVTAGPAYDYWTFSGVVVATWQRCTRV